MGPPPRAYSSPPRIALALALSACATTACRGAGPGPSPPAGVSVASITVTSKTFGSGGAIPVDFSCDGKNQAPELTWSAPPEGTASITIVVDDPDAPGGVFTHFIAADLPADQRSLKEGLDPSTLGAKIGKNDFDHTSYDGPCPPKGELHRYRFRVFALDRAIGGEGASRGQIDAAMNGHLLGEGALVGTFAH